MEKDLQISRGILLLVFTLNVESFERLEELIHILIYLHMYRSLTYLIPLLNYCHRVVVYVVKN